VAEAKTKQQYQPIPVKLNERSKAFVDQIKEETGMTQIAFMERLIEWYVAQSPRVQREIRDRNGDSASEFVRAKLGEMAFGGEMSMERLDLNQANELAQAALARMNHLAEVYKSEAQGKIASNKKK